jgi:hypothetical protein
LTSLALPVTARFAPGDMLIIVASFAQAIAGPRLLTTMSVVAVSVTLLSVGGSTVAVTR